MRERRLVACGCGALLFIAAVSGGCASAGSTAGVTPTPHPFPVPGGARSSPAPPARPASPALPGSPAARGAQTFDGYALVGAALALRGTPYKNGGTDPNGFDCSGFTQYVYGQQGMSLPRDVAEQFKRGKPVAPDTIAPGDLVFFATAGQGSQGASHVAISVGGDEFVHAPSSSGVVRVERISSSYWASRFVGARRIG